MRMVCISDIDFLNDSSYYTLFIIFVQLSFSPQEVQLLTHSLTGIGVLGALTYTWHLIGAN